MTAEDSAVISESPESLPHRIKELEQKLSKTEEALRETTKGWSLEYEYVNMGISTIDTNYAHIVDYLVTRHNAQETERQAQEEIFHLREKCVALQEEKEDLRERASVEATAIRKAIQEEGNICAQEFRKEAIVREQDMKILKDQYAAVQRSYTSRIENLEQRLNQSRRRYRQLEKRRALEIEGFSTDISSCKGQLYKLERQYYGTKVSQRERSALLTLKTVREPEALQAEMSRLQVRVSDSFMIVSSLGSLHELTCILLMALDTV